MEQIGSRQGYGPVRERFISTTFNHFGGVLLTFMVVEAVFFRSGLAGIIARSMLVLPWMAILGAFMLVGWLASRAAHTLKSVTAQNVALGACILAGAIIFVPLLYIANQATPGTIANAAMIAVLATLGLRAVAYASRKDFSFLGSVLKWGGLMAIVLIVCGATFGFELGVPFSAGMVAFAGASILYDASNIIHHYPEDRYVGASLEQFASVALMFWYVLRILMSLRN
jgi:FtsH-binding integral membrane protein